MLVEFTSWRNPSFFRRFGRQGKPGDSAGPGQYDAHKADRMVMDFMG